MVKLSRPKDPRRTPLIPHDTRKWRRLYRRRTAVERAFSRLKSRLLLDALWVRGLAKVRVRVTLSTLVLLAAALGMAQPNRWRELRSLVAWPSPRRPIPAAGEHSLESSLPAVSLTI